MSPAHRFPPMVQRSSVAVPQTARPPPRASVNFCAPPIGSALEQPEVTVTFFMARSPYTARTRARFASPPVQASVIPFGREEASITRLFRA